MKEELSAYMAMSPYTPFGPSKNATDVTEFSELPAARMLNCQDEEYIPGKY